MQRQKVLSLASDTEILRTAPRLLIKGHKLAAKNKLCPDCSSYSDYKHQRLWEFSLTFFVPVSRFQLVRKSSKIRVIRSVEEKMLVIRLRGFWLQDKLRTVGTNMNTVLIKTTSRSGKAWRLCKMCMKKKLNEKKKLF